MSAADSARPRPIPGGVTAPEGFLASGVCSGIKRDKEDLALLFSEREASVAGVFTQNAILAAPVLLCLERIVRGTARAVIVNSGNANACTGQAGLQNARAMAQRTAEALGLPDDSEVLVASTGIIGRPLPLAKIHNAVPAAVAALDRKGGEAAARAIMTTDTCPKSAAVEVDLSGGTVRIGGITKGAGMIRPRLAPPEQLAPHATMLGFLTTDAAVKPSVLQGLLERAVGGSFNAISVDGETSTNDTVLLFANGASGVVVDGQEGSAPNDLDVFYAGIETVCHALAHSIVRDGEGATKFVTIIVTGAADTRQAYEAGFAIADSMLVKTALFGNDPNWGRIVSAAGASGVEMRPDKIRVSLNGTEAFGNGKVNSEGEKALAGSLKGPEIQIQIDLGAGDGKATVWTSDLSYEYIKINAEYHT